MARAALTGTRVRERRAQLGLRQGDLAREVGISPAYLNLIEHNRRRVPDALLTRLAGALGTREEVLAEGAENRLFDALREAAAAMGAPVAGTEEAEAPRPERMLPPELDRIEEFAGRYPGWAALLAERQDRVAELDRRIEALTERLAHDPQLSGGLHEVLSAVTSIRSTAGILAETEDIDPEWRRRFHANLREDSERLAGAAQGLVAHLDADLSGRAAGGAPILASPQEELEGWLDGPEAPFDLVELPETRDTAGILRQRISQAAELASPAARELALQWLARAREDAWALPLERLLPELAAGRDDPFALAHGFGADPMRVLRRLGSLPEAATGRATGLVLADGAGAILRRRAIEGFTVPRFGAACPLWPLYQALAHPGQPIRARLVMQGRLPRRFEAFAFSQTSWPAGYEAEPVTGAAMLIRPASAPISATISATAPGAPELPVGPTCRICPREGCAARREPSILTEG